MDWKLELMKFLESLCYAESAIKDFWSGDKQSEILSEYRSFLKELENHNDELDKTDDSLLYDDRI
jgi:hypothetical protein